MQEAVPQVLFVGYEHCPSLRPAHVPEHVGSVPAQEVRLPCGFPEATAVQVPKKPVMSHAMHELVQAWSQQTPSGEQVVPVVQPVETVWQDWPFLLLQMPPESHVPPQRPFGSSALTTATHVWLLEQL